MKTVLKYTAAAVLTGALAMAVATPSEARSGRTAAAAGIGFAAGAVVGAAAANAANSSYYYGPAYYDYGYAYEPAYVYEPAPVYVAPSYGYRYRYSNPYRPYCAVDMGYGRLDYSNC